MSPGALLLGNAGHSFECSHPHSHGDRCLSFQFDAELFNELAAEAGAARTSFEISRLPPLRELAALVARATTASFRHDSYEEIGFELAGKVLELAAGSCNDHPTAGSADQTRIERVLRELEANAAAPRGLADLAEIAGLSRYHFLRTFRSVTGVTPHQWLLRARLRKAARRLVTSRAAVTEIALDVGFDDLSNFVRTFHAEFGVSPRKYRIGA